MKRKLVMKVEGRVYVDLVMVYGVSKTKYITQRVLTDALEGKLMWLPVSHMGDTTLDGELVITEYYNLDNVGQISVRRE